MKNELFTLGELGEFDSIFQQSNKNEFLKHFLSFVSNSVYNRVSLLYFTPNVDVCQYVATPLRCPYVSIVSLISIRLSQILADVEYVSDELLKDKVVDKLAFRAVCNAHIKSLNCSFVQSVQNLGRTMLIFKVRKRNDLKVSLQELFSVSIAHFQSKGWGTVDDFRNEVLLFKPDFGRFGLLV